MNTSFFGELLQTISERGRALLARDRRGEASARSESLVELCEDLLSGRGEASGVALAREILARYSALTIGPRIAFFEALARRFFADSDPIGTHLRVTLGDVTSDRDYEIIGIVPSVKHNTLTEEALPTFYGPMPQIPKPVAGFLANNFSVVIRTSMDAQTVAEFVRRELRTVDSDVAISTVKPLEQIVTASVASRRFNLVLLVAFAGTALLLAGVGIYGVIAFLVATRTREIGVRMALGARRIDVMRLILGHGLKLVLVGVAVGLLGALIATRGLTTLLFATAPTDPPTYAGVAALLTLVALLASYIPARRATKVDPLQALRSE